MEVRGLNKGIIDRRFLELVRVRLITSLDSGCLSIAHLIAANLAGLGISVHC